MTSYIDYSYYLDTFGGTLVDNDKEFYRFSLLASTYIDAITNIEIDAENVDEVIKMATCSVIDELKKQEMPEIASQSVGKESLSFSTTNKTKYKKLYESAEKWLLNTNYLYMGV